MYTPKLALCEGEHVLKGLPDVLETLKRSTISKLSWFLTPKHALVELTPVQTLQKGMLTEVLSEARDTGYWRALIGQDYSPAT